MLLAIDIGNTNSVFALCKGQEILQSWRLRTDTGRSCDEYASFLNQLLDLSDLKMRDISAVLIGSVVPEANFHVRKFCEKYIGLELQFVNAAMTGIAIDLDRPEEVGADRLVNAVAVKQSYSLPAIVIDFGTATTFDVIDKDGRYGGGAIAPGVKLSIAALHSAASKLPKISVSRPQSVIGKNTVSAMQSGIYYGYLALIEGIAQRMKAELGDEVFVLATGGLAPLFARDTDIIDAVDDDLTIKGLIKIYEDMKS